MAAEPPRTAGAASHTHSPTQNHSEMDWHSLNWAKLNQNVRRLHGPHPTPQTKLKANFSEVGYTGTKEKGTMNGR